MLCSCATGSSDSNRSASKNETPATDIVLAAYPDTSFASASIIESAIKVLDTINDGRIHSFDDPYESAPGVFTFRKNHSRDMGCITMATAPDTFFVEWAFKTDEDYTPTDFGIWGGGTGWTGQPIYVEWPDSMLNLFSQNGLKNVSREEIIAGSLTGEIYFIDFRTGRQSRPNINTGNPIKGTVSLDPTLNGNLYAGHGVPAHSRMKALTVDMKTGKITDSIPPDSGAPRGWQAYDSSPIRVGNFLFRPGENGVIYKYLVDGQKTTLHSKMHYKINGHSPGIESSMVVARNYGYVCDNNGNVICLNLNTMHPVWRYKLPDDTDATPVIANEDNSKPYIYVGSEQQNDSAGYASFVKLDALTGKEIWRTNIPALRKHVYDKAFDGGFYSTALLGRGDCDSLIFANCVKNTDLQNGSLIAFNRKTGKIVYDIPLDRYAWSSPIGLINNGRFFVFTADCSGNAYLISGSDGKIIHKAQIGTNFESSPVAIDESVVIGSRGNTIYKLKFQ